MFNQERGAGEKRRLWPAPTRRARPQQRAPGRAKWLCRLGGSPRTRVGLKWEDGGFLPPPQQAERGGSGVPALSFWLCEMLEALCLRQPDAERKEGLSDEQQKWQGSGAQALGLCGAAALRYSAAALPCKGCFWHLSSSPTGLRNIKLAWWPSALQFCNDTLRRSLYTSCFSGLSVPELFMVKAFKQNKGALPLAHTPSA